MEKKSVVPHSILEEWEGRMHEDSPFTQGLEDFNSHGFLWEWVRIFGPIGGQIGKRLTVRGHTEAVEVLKGLREVGRDRGLSFPRHPVTFRPPPTRTSGKKIDQDSLHARKSLTHGGGLIRMSTQLDLY